jgi:hypothetical protein
LFVPDLLSPLQDQEPSRTFTEAKSIEAWSRVEKANGSIVEISSDYAISGSSVRSLPGTRTLLEAAKSGTFDCVTAEALDRRHKQPSTRGAAVLTSAEMNSDGQLWQQQTLQPGRRRRGLQEEHRQRPEAVSEGERRSQKDVVFPALKRLNSARVQHGIMTPQPRRVSRSAPKDAAQRLRLSKHTTPISISGLESHSFAIGGSDEPTIQVQLNTLGGQIYLVPLSVLAARSCCWHSRTGDPRPPRSRWALASAWAGGASEVATTPGMLSDPLESISRQVLLPVGTKR